VREILSEAIETAGFKPHLVSEADDVGIIQKRIIQNVYENQIVVCDVSGKNPNVMFELGMRLAFDKPTVIVKDEKTPYSFDTGPIEHLEYPRDLRFNKIVGFKEGLSEKIKATHLKATEDPAYTPFLKHFGTFSVARLDTKEVPRDQFILEELKNIAMSVSEIRAEQRSIQRPEWGNRLRKLCLREATKEQAELIAKDVSLLVKNGTVRIIVRGVDHFHLEVLSSEVQDWKQLLSKARENCVTARLL